MSRRFQRWRCRSQGLCNLLAQVDRSDNVTKKKVLKAQETWAAKSKVSGRAHVYSFERSPCNCNSQESDDPYPSHTTWQDGPHTHAASDAGV